jgi:hypothetical protein
MYPAMSGGISILSIGSHAWLGAADNGLADVIEDIALALVIV